jgi:hypothetical protein
MAHVVLCLTRNWRLRLDADLSNEAGRKGLAACSTEMGTGQRLIVHNRRNFDKCIRERYVLVTLLLTYPA